MCVKEMASGRQNDVYHRVMESDDDDSADGDANVATSLTTVVVAAPQAPSTAKRTISSPLPMDVPAARSGEGIYFIFLLLKTRRFTQAKT